MPIPYRDADDLNELGAAGYLKIEPSSGGPGYLGALFLINARGEPVEFTYNRIETPHTFLWRQDDIRRHAERKLTASLLAICPRTPRILLCLAEEVGSALFCQDIQLSIPVCRIAPAMKAMAFSGQETQEVTEASEPMNLFWFPGRGSTRPVVGNLSSAGSTERTPPKSADRSFGQSRYPAVPVDVG